MKKISSRRIKLLFRCFSFFIVLLAGVIVTFGQKIIYSNIGCSSPGKEKPPVIFGKPYIIPPIPLRVVKASTGEPLVGVELHILYIWKWLEYPYPEHFLTGAWSPGCDAVLWELIPNKEGVFIFPEYKVEPRGWNKPPKNILTLFQKSEPYFDSIEFFVESKEKLIDKENPYRVDNPSIYQYSATLTRADIEKLKKKELVKLSSKQEI